jgi:hypothetical protein
MKKMKKAQKEWTEKDKNFKKRILSVRHHDDRGKKDDRWYMNSTAVVHVTHDLFLFISDLNTDDTELIETANDEQIETRDTEDVDLDVDNERNIFLLNVHYCFELDSNLISCLMYDLLIR